MKVLLLLCWFPLHLVALDYYCDDPNINAQICSYPESIRLDERGKVELKLTYPQTYQLKSVVYENDESELKWDQHSALVPDAQTLTFECEPFKKGEVLLNLPTLHFVDQDNPKKFVTLHPPLMFCHVTDFVEDPKEKLFLKDPVSLDLRRPIEMDQQNYHLMQMSKSDALKIKSTPWFAQPKNWRNIAAALLAAALVYFMIRKLQLRKKTSLAQKRQIDPQKLALQELEKLQKQMLIQNGYFEEFYVKLTQIVRLYIERKFQIKAPEQTTQEFLAEVLKRPLFKNEMKKHLSDFLKFADLVKFAKLHPATSDCERAERAAYEFIQSPESELKAGEGGS